jgi:hypothetical protein
VVDILDTPAIPLYEGTLWSPTPAIEGFPVLTNDFCRIVFVHPFRRDTGSHEMIELCVHLIQQGCSALQEGDRLVKEGDRIFWIHGQQEGWND